MRIVGADAGVGTFGDGAAASGVTIEDLVERGDATVVLVRRGDLDVAEGRRAELADVRRVAGEFVQARVARGIRPLPVDVGQAGVVEGDLVEEGALL